MELLNIEINSNTRISSNEVVSWLLNYIFFFSLKLLLNIFHKVINIQESISRGTSGALESINNNIMPPPCNIFLFIFLEILGHTLHGERFDWNHSHCLRPAQKLIEYIENVSPTNPIVWNFSQILLFRQLSAELVICRTCHLLIKEIREFLRDSRTYISLYIYLSGES